MDERAEAAFTAFFRSEQPSIFRTVFLMTSDSEAAKEITQDAFAQAFVHWRKVSRYERPGAWVRRVAIRLAGRARRRTLLQEKVLRKEIVFETEDSVFADPDLLEAIKALQPRERALIVLFYFEDLPLLEIAEILDIPEGTARVGLHRARQKLARSLEGS